jgi:hypothetical protein
MFDKCGEEIDLLKYTIHMDSKNYLILESIITTKSKTLHVINFDHSQFGFISVGRSEMADIRITDVSVSRTHCSLYLHNDGKIGLVEHGSRFGTTILVQRPIEVLRNVYLQVGRSALSISSENRFTCLQKFKQCLGFKQAWDENYLNYEEVARYFPQEFNWEFNYYPIDDPILEALKLKVFAFKKRR